MAMVLLANTSFASPGGNGGTTPAINTTGAALIIIAIARGAVTAPTDSAGNTWLALTTQTTSDMRLTIYYCLAPITSAAHTFSIAGAGIFPSMVVAAFSGVDVVAGLDQQSGAAGGAPPSPRAAGSITPTKNGELIASAFSGNVSPATVSGGLAIITAINYQAAAHYGLALAWLEQAAAAAINVTWTSTGGSYSAASVGSFFSGAKPLRTLMGVGT